MLFIFPSINSQELPLLNSRLDLSEFCGSEYNADGYQIRLCMPFSLIVPEGTRNSNETWDTRITNRRMKMIEKEILALTLVKKHLHHTESGKAKKC